MSARAAADAQARADYVRALADAAPPLDEQVRAGLRELFTAPPAAPQPRASRRRAA